MAATKKVIISDEEITYYSPWQQKQITIKESDLPVLAPGVDSGIKIVSSTIEPLRLPKYLNR